MLVLDAVEKSFTGVPAVKIPHLAIRPGTICGLLGPNGAGKTTTIRLIVGTVLPDTGTVTWEGVPIRTALRRRIGYLPEERGVYSDMNLTDQLCFFASINGLDRATASMETNRLLDQFQLDGSRRASELSKGNQQKLQLALAIIHRPRLLILDEPFTALDPFNNQLFRSTARSLADEGTTILLSTHDMEEAEEICDEVVFLDRGELRLSGSLQEIRSHRNFTSGINRIEVTTSVPLDAEQLASLPVKPSRADGCDLTFELHQRDECAAGALAQSLVGLSGLLRYERVRPSLRQIFIATASQGTCDE